MCIRKNFNWTKTVKYPKKIQMLIKKNSHLGNSRSKEQARVSSQWKDPLWVPIVTLSELPLLTLIVMKLLAMLWCEMVMTNLWSWSRVFPLILMKLKIFCKGTGYFRTIFVNGVSMSHTCAVPRFSHMRAAASWALRHAHGTQSRL